MQMLMALAVLSVTWQPAAPDFSGHWDRDQWNSVVIAMDAQKMTITDPKGPGGKPVVRTYLLDGSESHNQSPGPRGEPGARMVYTSRWDGDKLVTEIRFAAVQDPNAVRTETRWLEDANTMIVDTYIRRREGWVTERETYKRKPAGGYASSQ